MDREKLMKKLSLPNGDYCHSPTLSILMNGKKALLRNQPPRYNKDNDSILEELGMSTVQ
jgi:hypothetical protein